MDKKRYEIIIKDVIQPIINKVEGIDNYFLRELWMTVLDATERSLSGILFFSPDDINFDKDIKEEDILFWFKKVSLCFVSWIYYAYTKEQRKDLINKEYFCFEKNTCGGRILDVYKDLFGEVPNCKDILKYALGLKEDEESGFSATGNFDATGRLALKDYEVIGRELIENIWKVNTNGISIYDGKDPAKTNKSNPIAKKIAFLGLRLWQAHQQIIQPFLTKNLVRRALKWNRIVPITSGLGAIIVGVLILYFFGSNILTWVIGGILFFYAWTNLKIGLFGSKKLIDELTQDRRKALSREADEELRKFLK